MAIDLARFIDRFVDEAREHLGRLGEGVAALQAGERDAELINALFRSAHTIKGSSRMLKLAPITDIAHRLEDVLGALREGRLAFDGRLADALYLGIDGLAALVDRLADSRDAASLPAADPSLCERLAAAAAGELDAAFVPAPSPATAAPHTAPAATEPAAPSTPRPAVESVRLRVDKLDELIGLLGELASSQARAGAWVEQMQALERALVRDLEHPERQSALLARVRALSSALRDGVGAQETMIASLHERALQMRMLPVSVIFESLGRTVRDFARSLGKDAELVVHGGDIELDRHIIDRLADPLVHLLRNAIDHGLEAPALRRSLGKRERGQVELTARQDGAHAVIEIADDGAGFDFEAVRAKAVARGMVDAESAAALADTDLIDLLFLPGMSTAAIITDVSGRGVGLDVVRRTLIEDLSGEVGVHARPGEGVRFVLRLPTSLARLRMLVVGAGGQALALPAHAVNEIVYRDAEALLRVAERDAVIVHNEFVPVVGLAALLGLPQAAVADGARLLVVIGVRGEKAALQVDTLLDERDMVIKPMPALLAQLRLVAGVVETGAGALAPVLHAPSLLAQVRSVGSAARASTAAQAPHRQHLLVVDDSLNTRELEKEVLEAHGYQVTLAEDGVDGLAKALAEDFDAVLTDVEMPRMDGFTLTARLREEERYRHRPILIITSREREEDKRRGMQVGADAYIVKGDFDQRSLIDTLQTLLA